VARAVVRAAGAVQEAVVGAGLFAVVVAGAAAVAAVDAVHGAAGVTVMDVGIVVVAVTVTGASARSSPPEQPVIGSDAARSRASAVAGLVRIGPTPSLVPVPRPRVLLARRSSLMAGNIAIGWPTNRSRRSFWRHPA
jgi:hypothetical protein